MEQKKVQRIVGILVIIAIVIVVMPLLFGKNNFPVQQAANIKAPPFPDQPQATEATSSDSSLPVLASAANMDNAEANPVPPPTNPTQIMPSTDQTIHDKTLPTPPELSSDVKATPIANIQPSDATKPDSNPSANTSSAESQTVVVTPEMAKKINEDSATGTTSSNIENKPAGTVIYEPVTNAPADAQKPAEKSVEQPVKHSVEQASALPVAQAQPVQPVIAAPVKPVIAKVKQPRTPKLAHARLKSRGHAHPVMQAKISSGWAVQMGNFSVKQNAVRLANSLQTAGYKAFIKEITLQDGRTRTRVYIGPEHKQTAAVALSKNIHQKLSMQGFVVPLNKA